jgi:hypothetical protein
MPRTAAFRLGLFLLVLFATIALFYVGCGSSGDGSTFVVLPGADSSLPEQPAPPPFGDSGGPDPDASTTDAPGQLVVVPATATIAVTIANGVVTSNPPVTFQAYYEGKLINATWLFDRGELGDVDATTGIFTASAKGVGEGTITARFGAREGSAKVKINVAATQNGGPADAGADAGLGGLGGVGGEPLGPAVDASTVTRLKTEVNLPATPQELGFLYPYDKTVWPRGLLPPLLMWRTTHTAEAVYVKLSQGNFTFEGTYSVAGRTAVQRARARIDEAAWRIATNGNQGDDLVAEVKIFDAGDNKVYGPIVEKWKVAPGVLRGTVYYNSYDSRVTSGGGSQLGGVIAIKPRSPDPVLAVPSMQGKCHVCHEVSADGSRLFAQDGKVDFVTPGPDAYENGASYDLTNNGARTTYQALPSPPGVAQNNRKFVWAGIYPDGSFGLASSRFAREAYLQTDAKTFSSVDGTEIPALGLSAVQSAVTPAFSPDGRKVAFNFWEGPGAGGVTAGGGRSLALFDFSCGQQQGSVKCSPTATFQFSNLRQIYYDANRYPAWPAFLPDGKAVVFHNTVQGGQCGPGLNDAGVRTPDRNSIHNCQLTTWFNAKAELWIAQDAATQTARRLDAANGVGFLPTNASHPDDTVLNYQPTVNPVPSGGYYWVVFTSRRMYGNLADGDPFNSSPDPKKLWVAAIDINAQGGVDPSHPAFYLPGQELDAGNSRGFWVVDPCKPNGQSCETGDECCNGFCRKDPDGGALVCMDKPPGNVCAEEFEKCVIDADCCDPRLKCINGKCSKPDPKIN